MTEDAALAIYAANTDVLATRYDGVATETVLAGLLDLIPPPPARVLDAGAGSGRDAAWFAAQGHAVTAAEPVAGFRARIAARAPQVALSDASLPGLEGLAGPFDLILVNAVWHHLTTSARDTALRRLAGLLAPGGRLLVSLRIGPVPQGQPLHALDVEVEIGRTAATGLALLRRHDAPAHDAATATAGIGWTWLSLCKEPAP